MNKMHQVHDLHLPGQTYAAMLLARNKLVTDQPFATPRRDKWLGGANDRLSG